MHSEICTCHISCEVMLDSATAMSGSPPADRCACAAAWPTAALMASGGSQSPRRSAVKPTARELPLRSALALFAFLFGRRGVGRVAAGRAVARFLRRIVASANDVATGDVHRHVGVDGVLFGGGFGG